MSEEMKVVYVRSGCLDCLEYEGEPLLAVEVNRPTESCLLFFFFFLFFLSACKMLQNWCTRGNWFFRPVSHI